VCFAAIIFILIVFISVQSILLLDQTSNKEVVTTQDTAPVWDFQKIEPTGTTYTLTLKNNYGQVRTYTEISSFGLSFKGEYLAIYKSGLFQVINLNTDEVAAKYENLISTIFINKGESLSWNTKDSLFVTSVLDTQKKVTYIGYFDILYSSAALNRVNIPYTDGYIEPAVFSYTNNLILVRTYSIDDLEYPNPDGSRPNMYQVPAYLNVYDDASSLINEFQVSDYSSGTYIDYGFDERGRVKYLISDTPIANPVADDRYVKVIL